MRDSRGSRVFEFKWKNKRETGICWIADRNMPIPRVNVVHFPPRVLGGNPRMLGEPAKCGTGWKLLAKILSRLLPVGRMPRRLFAMRRAREPRERATPSVFQSKNRLNLNLFPPRCAVFPIILFARDSPLVVHCSRRVLSRFPRETQDRVDELYRRFQRRIDDDGRSTLCYRAIDGHAGRGRDQE